MQRITVYGSHGAVSSLTATRKDQADPLEKQNPETAVADPTINTTNVSDLDFYYPEFITRRKNAKREKKSQQRAHHLKSLLDILPLATRHTEWLSQLPYDGICPCCEQQYETREHLFTCPSIPEDVKQEFSTAFSNGVLSTTK